MEANTNKTGGKKKIQTIDPIYQKFTKSVVRALGSLEFYQFFMDAVSKAENEIQFSNRRTEKTVDLRWVEMIESSLQAFQSIISNPRRVIQEEELIVNVANARKGGADVVQHLAQHASLVEQFDEKTNEVRPSRVMQKYREDAFGQYENRLIFTALDTAYTFVKIRHDALLSAMSDEFGAKLQVKSKMNSATEMVYLDMFLHIKETDAPLETDIKNTDELARVSRIFRVLTMYMNTAFAQEMAKSSKVQGQIVKTNVLKRNPNYRKIVELMEFLRDYQDVGYSVRITEQNPQISETFQQDIYHNILFNYLVLKGYLEDEKNRKLPKPFKEKQRKLKPKFIKEIIEELTEDYDLPDVEIRKVLIEELTKEQLMYEEEKERLRLVEEQEQRRREEGERIRQEQEAEKERRRVEKELALERKRQEKAAAEEQRRIERMRREQADARRCDLLRKDLDLFADNLQQQKNARDKLQAKQEQIQDFADAVQVLEDTAKRRLESQQRKKQRLQEIKERKEREELLAQQEKQRQEEERLRQEEQHLLELAEAAVAPYREEVMHFLETLPEQQTSRQQLLQQQINTQRLREEEIRKRRAMRAEQLTK